MNLTALNQQVNLNEGYTIYSITITLDNPDNYDESMILASVENIFANYLQETKDIRIERVSPKVLHCYAIESLDELELANIYRFIYQFAQGYIRSEDPIERAELITWANLPVIQRAINRTKIRDAYLYYNSDDSEFILLEDPATTEDPDLDIVTEFNHYIYIYID